MKSKFLYTNLDRPICILVPFRARDEQNMQVQTHTPLYSQNTVHGSRQVLRARSGCTRARLCYSKFELNMLMLRSSKVDPLWSRICSMSESSCGACAPSPAGAAPPPAPPAPAPPPPPHDHIPAKTKVLYLAIYTIDTIVTQKAIL